MAGSETSGEGIVDEDGRFDHHQKVTDRQIHDEYVGRRP